MENASGKRKNLNVEWIILSVLILFFQFIYYKNVEIATMYPDSYGYINMDLHGVLSGSRMPIYPLFITINRLLFADNYLIGVVCGQIILSLVGTVVLWWLIYMATDNARISAVMYILWGCNPGVIGYNVLILTESFAISFSVFLLYFAVRYLKYGQTKDGILMSVIGFIATWLKPALFIYTGSIMILLVIQYMIDKEHRSRIIKIVGINLLFIGVYLIYAYSVWIHSGVFNLSLQPPRHMLAASLASGIYKNYPDQRLVEEIEKIYAEHDHSIDYGTTSPIMQLFGDSGRSRNINVGNFVSYCIRSDMLTYIKYLLKIVWNNLNTLFTDSYAHMVYENSLGSYLIAIQNFLFTWIKIGHVYLIGAGALIIAVIKWVKDKKCPWYFLCTAGIIFAVIGSVYIGTYSEFMRSTAYVLPFAYFGLALLLKEFTAFIMRAPSKDRSAESE